MTMMYRVCGIDEAKLQVLARKQAAAVLKEMKAASERGRTPAVQPRLLPGQTRAIAASPICAPWPAIPCTKRN